MGLLETLVESCGQKFLLNKARTFGITQSDLTGMTAAYVVAPSHLDMIYLVVSCTKLVRLQCGDNKNNLKLALFWCTDM